MKRVGEGESGRGEKKSNGVLICIFLPLSHSPTLLLRSRRLCQMQAFWRIGVLAHENRSQLQPAPQYIFYFAPLRQHANGLRLGAAPGKRASSTRLPPLRQGGVPPRPWN